MARGRPSLYAVRVNAEPYRVARSVRRLVETRLFALWTDAEADRYARAFWALARSSPGEPLPLLLADHRPVRAYPASVLTHLDKVFASLNVKLERVAILSDLNHAAVTLQLQRSVDKAGFAGRRLFTDAEAAVAHLAPVLTPAELARAQAFVAEWPPAS